MKKSFYLMLCLILVSRVSFSQTRDQKKHFPPHHPLFSRFENKSDKDSIKKAFDEKLVEKLPPRFIDTAIELPEMSKKPVKHGEFDVRKELAGKIINSTASDSIIEDWVRQYSNLGRSSSDYSYAIAIDPNDGSIYVTGSSDSLLFGFDYLTIKYSSNGAFIWSARYNGPGNSGDEAYSIAVDNSGNVYVTGNSMSGTEYDYATIKYNSSGVQQWVARYNGPADGDEYTPSLAVDNSGNVYVTGTSYGSGTNFDYATVKYNSSGVEQWVARYNGPGNGDDLASSLAVDNSGNVYVTGYSYGLNTNNDYATIKYDSSGVQQWAKRYDGPGNLYDEATSIAVDNSGNVYVTGSSFDSGDNTDYATIKYSSSGATRWMARYNGPGNSYDEATSIAVDNSGNVYVTGSSFDLGTSTDYATIKYNSSGVEQWVARYNGLWNSYDNAYSIAVDNSGNIYVMGRSCSGSSTDYDYATLKYNSSGVQLWSVIYNGPGDSFDDPSSMVIDNSGNVYVTGYGDGSGTYYDYSTVKYNSTGVQQWAKRYDGPGNSTDRVSSLAVDNSGNVYITGTSFSSDTYDDYSTVKYNSSGVEQWEARFNGLVNSNDYALSIAVDNSGNVYVTGNSMSGTGYDYATIKYNSSGIEQWVAIYNGPGNGDDYAYSIAVDNSGNVYVAGTSDGSGTYADYATIKYNSSGVEQWVARYNGPGNGGDNASSLAVDYSGNVYVTGTSYSSGTFNDYATIKYDSSGVQQWATIYNGPGNSNDNISSIAIDNSGHVYVTGTSSAVSTYDKYDMTTIKYDSSGVQQWVAIYNGPVDSWDASSAVAVDNFGNVYATGYSYSGTSFDYATIKYNVSGVEQWVAIYNGPGNWNDRATSIAVNNSGNVYITGFSYGSGTDYDYATIKYNSSGAEQWVARYNGPGNIADQARAIAVDPSGSVYITGSSAFNTSSVYTTIKYAQQMPTLDVLPPFVWFGPRSVGCTDWNYGLIKTGHSGTLKITSIYSDHPYFVPDLTSATIMAGDSLQIGITATIPDTGVIGGHIIFVSNATSSPDTLGVFIQGVLPDSTVVVRPEFSVHTWQMVSLPVKHSNCPKRLSPLFKYDGTYIAVDTLEPLIGYWTKLSVPLIFSGESMLRETLHVKEGWNMVGSITNPLAVNDIGTEPPEMTTSQFFAYSGSYIIVDSLEPGRGYWMKSDRDGDLILDAGSEALAPNRIRIVNHGETPPAPPESSDAPLSVKPTTYMLDQNYPNPFNPSTTFQFSIVNSQLTILKVYDVLGREVATLVNEVKQPGTYTVEWDADGMASGMYFYRLYAGNFIETKKLILIR